MNSISKRKFPYPFKCALALCSDLDGTATIDKYLELQKYLCTESDTSAGRGLGLETGNSFWFFRNTDNPGISYFNNLSVKQTNFAAIARELIRAGYIDVLHTYGDFENGGFERKFAEESVNEIAKESLKLKTWVNHGGLNNSQNIGAIKGYKGDMSGSNSYHMDLIKQTNIRYFWLSQITHLVGQDSKITFNNFLKNQAQKLLAVKYGSRQIKPFFNNRLMDKIELRDGTNVYAFQRFINPWGKYAYTDINNIPYQINSSVLQELIDNNGYLILYTHLGNNPGGGEQIPAAARKILEELANQSREGNIFITTTTRLLTYYEVWNKLEYDLSVKDELFEINLKSVSDPEDLIGITFYTPEPQKTILKMNGGEIKTTKNHPDYTGMRSISIPWTRLQYPL
jgi:hypothetical protein